MYGYLKEGHARLKIENVYNVWCRAEKQVTQSIFTRPYSQTQSSSSLIRDLVKDDIFVLVSLY
jgi:hypothetical protein